MSFFDTQLGENLRTALEERLDDAIAGAVEEVLDAVWSRNLNEYQIQEAVAALENHLAFTQVLLVGDAAIACGLATFETRRRYCQTLIEAGALHASEQELVRLIEEEEISAKERGEALGLLGRLHKQRFVRSGQASDIAEAIHIYKLGYERGTDPAWHGVNLLALIRRSEADGHPIPEGLPEVSALAEELLTAVRGKPANQQFVWDRATEVELLIALNRSDEAREVIEQLTASRRVNAFHLGSLRRQLTEIWHLDEAHPVLLALSDQMLQHGHNSAIDLPDSPAQFEKIFDAAFPIGYQVTPEWVIEHLAQHEAEHRGQIWEARVAGENALGTTATVPS